MLEKSIIIDAQFDRVRDGSAIRLTEIRVLVLDDQRHVVSVAAVVADEDFQRGPTKAGIDLGTLHQAVECARHVIGTVVADNYELAACCRRERALDQRQRGSCDIHRTGHTDLVKVRARHPVVVDLDTQYSTGLDRKGVRAENSRAGSWRNDATTLDCDGTGRSRTAERCA